MDEMFFHLQPLERRYPAELQVAHIGNVPEKSDVVRGEFSIFNFSFVVRGAGFYDWRGKRFAVRAPSVLRQWPKEPMHYGPDRTTRPRPSTRSHGAATSPRSVRSGR